MKKLCLTMTAVFFLVCSIGVQAQTTQAQLNQMELMKQFLGTWQATYPNDTIVTFEMQQFGKAFVENDYVTVKGKEYLDSKWSYGFSPEEGKFKFFAVYITGKYQTWIGSFTSEKKWVQEMVQDFNPKKVLIKAEMVFETTTSISVSAFDMKGVKILEFKWSKIK